MSNKAETKGQVTGPSKEQVEAWKREFGDVFRLDVDGGYTCYLKKPTRRIYSMALSQGQKSPMRFNEIIINNCWITGDEQIREEDDLFYAACGQIDVLIPEVAADIKKL